METEIKPHRIITWLAIFLLLPVLGIAKSKQPVAKKVPLYKIVVTCPKGMSLYIRQPSGFKVIKDNIIEQHYSWFTWDGESQIWSSKDAATPTCFDKPPVETR